MCPSSDSFVTVFKSVIFKCSPVTAFVAFHNLVLCLLKLCEEETKEGRMNREWEKTIKEKRGRDEDRKRDKTLLYLS